ncbi:hypothetical protein AD936_16070 [Gluconobacter japonicus]|nr:hypothetical protein AD936_16070 [Gluconobacter japonicus]
MNKALGPAPTVLTVYSVALAALLCTLPVLGLSNTSEPFIDRLSHVHGGRGAAASSMSRLSSPVLWQHGKSVQPLSL